MPSYCWRCEVLVPQYDLKLSSPLHSSSRGRFADKGKGVLTSLMIPHLSLKYAARLEACPAILPFPLLVVNPPRIGSKCTGGISNESTIAKCDSILISEGSGACVSSFAYHQLLTFREMTGLTPSCKISYALFKPVKETRDDESTISPAIMMSSPSPLRYSLAQNSSPVSHSSSGISFYRQPNLGSNIPQ